MPILDQIRNTNDQPLRNVDKIKYNFLVGYKLGMS